MNSLGYSAVDRGSVSSGTPGTGVTAVTRGDGYTMTTILTLAGVLPAITGGAAQAVGLKVFDFPAGVTRVKCTRMNVAITQSQGNITNDTPVVGIGTVVATGSVAVLNGTAGFDDYVVETAAADCNGTQTDLAEDTTVAGLKLNAGGVKAVHFNAADTWAASGDAAATVTGEIHIEWNFLGA